MPILMKIILLSLCCINIAFAGKEVAFSILTLDEATKQVIEQNKSKVLGAQTELIKGKEVHIIKVLTQDGRVQYLKVDAESGKIIE